jgi:hypothetical protein
VEWGTVEGIGLEHSVKLKWSTLSETNTDLFLVERASDNGDFVEIGTVDAAGLSTSLLKYEFVDLAPAPGVNRYRIIQVDNNGGTANSPATEVNFAGPAGLVWGAVGPNPASDFVNLTFYNDHSAAMTLSMFDLNGKAVIQKDIQAVDGANVVRLSLANVDAGTYFVRLQGTGGKLTRKILKL